MVQCRFAARVSAFVLLLLPWGSKGYGDDLCKKLFESITHPIVLTVSFGNISPAAKRLNDSYALLSILPSDKARRTHVPALEHYVQEMLPKLMSKSELHPNIHSRMIETIQSIRAKLKSPTAREALEVSPKVAAAIADYIEFVSQRNLVMDLQSRLHAKNLNLPDFMDLSIEWAFWMDAFLSESGELPPIEERLDDFEFLSRVTESVSDMNRIFPRGLIIPTTDSLGYTDFVAFSPRPIFPLGLVSEVAVADGKRTGPIGFFAHDTGHAQANVSAGRLWGTIFSGSLASMRQDLSQRQKLVDRVFKLASQELSPRLQRALIIVWFAAAHETGRPMPITFLQFGDAWTVVAFSLQGNDTEYGRLTAQDLKDAETWLTAVLRPGLDNLFVRFLKFRLKRDR